MQLHKRLVEQEDAYQSLQRHYDELMAEQRQQMDALQKNYTEECRIFESELLNLKEKYQKRSTELHEMTRERDILAKKAETVDELTTANQELMTLN